MASSSPSEHQRPTLAELAKFIRKDSMNKPRIMGIVNVTPDSFHKESRKEGGSAISTALEMWDSGALWVDIGGESTRPGSDEVSLEEELDRVIPVIKELKKIKPDGLISIDTKKVEVAKQAILAGALMINDVSGLRNKEMFELVLSERIPVCIMHMQNNPKNMQASPYYDDCLDEVCELLFSKADDLISNGYPKELIILDPGIGFGKLLTHNLELLRGIEKMRRGQFSILHGASRKSIIGELTNNKSTEKRLPGSLAVSAFGQMKGVDIIRVHDVEEHVDLTRVLSAIMNE